MIYINGRFLFQKPTGVQRFAFDLLNEINGKIDFVVLIPKELEQKNIPFNIQVIKGGKGHFWEQITLPRYVNKQKVTLLNLCNLAPLFCNNNWITIHDLAFLENKKWFSFAFRNVYKIIIPTLTKKAKKIFTVSNTIKSDLVTILGVSPQKIEVLYNKVNKAFQEDIGEKVKGLDNKFILTVGSINPRKNYEWLSNFFANREDYQLVIVGDISKNFNEVKLNLQNAKHIQNCNVSQLKWLYLNASCYINFSLYEGFGIPTIEAMSTNLPIICSDIPINREIGGDEVNFVALNDKDGLDKMVKNISTNRKTYQRYSFFQNMDRAQIIKGLK